MISFNFRLIYGLRVLQKGIKIGPSDCIQMSETSEPRDPTRGPTAGPWTPRRFMLRSLCSNFFSTPLQKTFRRPSDNWNKFQSNGQSNRFWSEKDPNKIENLVLKIEF